MLCGTGQHEQDLGPSKTSQEPAIQQYLLSIAPASRRTALGSLDTVAGILLNARRATPRPELPPRDQVSWANLRHPEIQALRAKLARRFAPATANKMLSFVRGVLRACRDLGLMSAPDCEAAISVPNVPAIWHPAEIQLLREREVRALFEACAAAPGAGGHRDAALLAVFLSSGLRRTEAAMLNVEDFRAGDIMLRVPVASGSHRLAPLGPAVARYLRTWLAVHGMHHPGTPLLVPVNKSGRIQYRRLTDQAIYNMIRRIGIAARLPAVTSRALRQTYLVNLIAGGMPLDEVQQRIGHASWVSTQAYRDLAQLARQNGFKPFDLPYLQQKKGDKR
jgi:integrase/recombinase XerD